MGRKIMAKKRDTMGKKRRTELYHDLGENLPTQVIAEKYDLSERTVRSYKDEMRVMPSAYEMLEDGKGVVKMLKEVIVTSKKLYDSYLAYLADSENPDYIDPTPRATEIDVVYFEKDKDGKILRRGKATLQRLLEDIKQEGKDVTYVHVNTTDIRKLIIDQVNALTRQLELIAKIQGQVKDVTISVVNSPVWIQIQQIILDAVKDNPEIRERMAKEFAQLGN